MIYFRKITNMASRLDRLYSAAYPVVEPASLDDPGCITIQDLRHVLAVDIDKFDEFWLEDV